MQLFSADAAIFFLKRLDFFCPWKHEKASLKSCSAHNQPKLFFSVYCPPAQNQPKSHFPFHKNGSLRNFVCNISSHKSILCKIKSMLSKPIINF